MSFLGLILLLAAQAAGLLEQADAAFRAGDLDRAAALAGRVVQADASAVHGHLILGVVAAQRGRWDAANRSFQRVVQLDPKNPHGHFYLGQAALYQHRWEPAVGHFLEARRRGYPDAPRLGLELAFALNEAGRPKEALQAIDRLPPEGAQYHAVRAFALGKLHQPVAALESMRRARDLDPTKPEYWAFLISTLLDTDQTTFALAEAIPAQRRFPDDPDLQFLFALASFYVTESPLTPLAVRNLRESEPESPRVLLAEGLLYRKQGQSEQATQRFQQAAKQGVRDAHLLLGILLKEAGDYAGAEREYREAEKENPYNGQVLLEMGKLLLTRGEVPAALERLERAVQQMPTNSAAHYQLGLAYGRAGQKEKAELAMQRYRELEKQQAELLRPAAKP
jgi:Flp pilus assembly protein TadD